MLHCQSGETVGLTPGLLSMIGVIVVVSYTKVKFCQKISLYVKNRLRYVK